MSAETQKVDVLSHALNCFNCEAEGPSSDTYARAEKLAGEAGWMIGLDPDSEHADANFACPDCVELLIAPVALARVGGAA